LIVSTTNQTSKVYPLKGGKTLNMKNSEDEKHPRENKYLNLKLLWIKLGFRKRYFLCLSPACDQPSDENQTILTQNNYLRTVQVAMNHCIKIKIFLSPFSHSQKNNTYTLKHTDVVKLK
jgi:hypothetical protein